MTDLGITGVGDATLIASGGSALVYRALSGTGEQLAVKVLRGVRGEEVTRRFEREQSAAERLHGHPNIIRVHHSGVSAAGEPYLVMPLFEGGSLHDELQAVGAFALNQAVADVTTAAQAIDYAHSRGVLHRDVKPANLLRGNDGSVIVTDFGIARVTDAGITSATMGASTPLYAAPELLAENEVSIHSEVYALGATLYTLLAGAPAFGDSDNIWASMTRIRTETPAPIAGVPAPVMRVIHQAMAKEPWQRPAGAGTFATLLNTAMIADETWHPPAPTQTAELPRDLPIDMPAVPRSIATGSTASSTDPLAAPPAPRLNRPAPAVGTAPSHESSSVKIVAALVALAVVAGLAWFGVTRLLDRNSVATTAIEPPVDNSLPSPTTSPNNGGGDDDDGGDGGADGDGETPAAVPTPPTRLVSFTGDHFSAYLPEGWSLSNKDIQEDYGFRSKFVSPTMYLNIDTTPREQRTSGIEISQSAREIAASISSASEVRTEEVEGLLMHSFTFRNRQGVDSIDIFFEVDGDGYAIVAGSETDPDGAFAIARFVALSIRSNPDQ